MESDVATILGKIACNLIFGTIAVVVVGFSDERKAWYITIAINAFMSVVIWKLI